METGKTLHGTARLAFDAVEGLSHIVEGMYRNIAAAPLPFGREPEGPARGIAGLVHEAVRQVNSGVRVASDLAFKPLVGHIDRFYPPGPYRAAAIAAVNGVCGDHLARTGNPLAISMRLRVFLPPMEERGVEGVAVAPKVAFARLFETRRNPVEIYPEAKAVADSGFTPGGRILILAHGLCMNDMEWTSDEYNHGHMLADYCGYTPVYVHYNSGRHISENGREFAEQISGLLANWPVPVESITLVGFSMGGLLARSALHVANEEQLDWLNKVDKVVYIGTPHHGSALERGGFWLQKSTTFSPYTAPLSALGKIRSAGITDLRHGNVRDADWQGHDEHEDNADHRQLSPLIEGVEHFAIGATLSAEAAGGIKKLRSDGLVHPTSSHGIHEQVQRHLAFPEGHTRLVYGVGHLGMLSDQRVAAQLREWLGR